MPTGRRPGRFPVAVPGPDYALGLLGGASGELGETRIWGLFRTTPGLQSQICCFNELRNTNLEERASVVEPNPDSFIHVQHQSKHLAPLGCYVLTHIKSESWFSLAWVAAQLLDCCQGAALILIVSSQASPLEPLAP